MSRTKSASSGDGKRCYQNRASADGERNYKPSLLLSILSSKSPLRCASDALG